MPHAWEKTRFQTDFMASIPGMVRWKCAHCGAKITLRSERIPLPTDTVWVVEMESPRLRLSCEDYQAWQIHHT